MTDRPNFRVETVTGGADVAGVLADLHATCFAQSAQETWSENTIATLLRAPGNVGAIAVAPHGGAIGFIIGRAIGDEGEVLTLCVSPTARRQGIATALIVKLRELLAPRQRLLLEVAVNNQGARKLYLRLGFDEVGRRPGYYKRGGKSVDALVLANG
ncbi:MAG: GNAT family N-acetyltransferase [Alphaproteobacteria bacterium]|nr:GNAT family N-acetyltransferase [Alphaproteobacteria bacterium]